MSCEYYNLNIGDRRKTNNKAKCARCGRSTGGHNLTYQGHWRDPNGRMFDVFLFDEEWDCACGNHMVMHSIPCNDPNVETAGEQIFGSDDAAYNFAASLGGGATKRSLLPWG